MATTTVPSPVPVRFFHASVVDVSVCASCQMIRPGVSCAQVVGSVSGGCVEPAVFEEAMDAIEGGRPRLLTYGISDDEAFGVGLTCGGVIHIFVERVDW